MCFDSISCCNTVLAEHQNTVWDRWQIPYLLCLALYNQLPKLIIIPCNGLIPEFVTVSVMWRRQPLLIYHDCVTKNLNTKQIIKSNFFLQEVILTFSPKCHLDYLMHNSFILQQYISYTALLNMFRAARCSSSGGPIVITTVSGIVTLCKQQYSMQVESALHPHTVRLLTEGDNTRGCGNTISPPDDEQCAA